MSQFKNRTWKYFQVYFPLAPVLLELIFRAAFGWTSFDLFHVVPFGSIAAATAILCMVIIAAIWEKILPGRDIVDQDEKGAAAVILTANSFFATGFLVGYAISDQLLYSTPKSDLLASGRSLFALIIVIHLLGLLKYASFLNKKWLCLPEFENV